jgi:hypothetical protein
LALTLHTNKPEDFAAVFAVAWAGRATPFPVREVQEEVIAPPVSTLGGACGAACDNLRSASLELLKARFVNAWIGGVHVTCWSKTYARLGV